jgi:two-component system, sensor histidine kinase RegB
MATSQALTVGLDRWLRLRWWLAPLQIAAVALAGPLPYAAPQWSLGVVLCLSLAPGFLTHGLRGAGSPRVILAGSLLGDFVLLTVSLALCGGPSNPFSVLYLVYLTLACVLLGPVFGWIGAGVAAVCYAGLFLLPARPGDHAGHMHGGPTELWRHLWSMYFAFVAVSVLVVGFVASVMRVLRRREAELAEAQERAARNERLANVLVLAAGTAHEMATPLSTIAVTAKEMEREASLAGQGAVAEDARLIRGEVKRCRRLLDELRGQAGAIEGEAPVSLSLHEALQAATASLAETTRARVILAEAAASVRLLLPRAAFVQVLGNVVRNAIEASSPADPVVIDATVGESTITVRVADRGRGMDDATRARALEPFFTTKPPGVGLGLGLFLADRFTRDVGGRLVLDSLPGRGTEVRMEFSA